MRALMNDIYRRGLESARGKITFASGLWEWCDDPPTEILAAFEADPEKTTYFHYTDEGTNGFIMYKFHKTHKRFYRLVKGPSVFCWHPQWADEDYVPDGKRSDMHYVPSRLCKRCEHYRKGGSVNRKVRYPTCGWRASDAPEQDAAGKVLGIFAEATKLTEEMLGTSPRAAARQQGGEEG